MSRRLSESKMRALAEERGFPVTHEQFDGYVAWGLLPKSGSDRRWPEEITERLVQVRQLSKTVRPLPRRVLQLHGKLPDRPDRDHGVQDATLYRVPPDKLRDAMIALLPTIVAPARKMKEAERALAWWAQCSTGPRLAKEVALPPDWRVKQHSSWPGILEDADLAVFEARAGAQYHVMRGVLPVYTKDTPYDLATIPEEERVTLLTVRDLAIFAMMRQQARAKE